MSAMAYRFHKHYTREEAGALLPLIRRWLEQLDLFRAQALPANEHIRALTNDGRDAGGKVVNDWVRTQAGLREIVAEFQRREILLKDADRGLIDFPAIIGGREVFLCWERGEDEIEFWHAIEDGYAGRERL
jgi:hypothetical protein